MTTTVAGIEVPSSPLAIEAAAVIRDQVGELLFDHSSRVYLFGALHGRRQGLDPDPELLYVAALFHDLGLTGRYASTSTQRFEMDGADAAQEFLREHGRSAADARTVWLAIALHTTPQVPGALQPEVALVTAGVETDVLGLELELLTPEARAAVVSAHPRPNFKERITRAFYDGFAQRPETTFGTMNDDVIAHFEPDFRRENFVEIIRSSGWPE